MERFGVLALALVLPCAGQPASPVTTLYSFTGGNDGANPYSSLLGIGKTLYGTTYAGGPANLGTVFQLTAPSTIGRVWTETVLHTFAGNGDGSSPLAGLLMGKTGNLYGTTKYGGAVSGCGGSGCGTIFELMPPVSPGGAWTESILYSFTGRNGDGAKPYAGLAIDATGNLYGTTYQGGTAGYGTVFMLKPPVTKGGAWTETVLHSFTGQSGQDGGLPSAGVLLGANGVLYGTTDYGGTSSRGAVYQLAPPAGGGAGAWTASLIYSFTGKDGDLPYAGLVMGQNGVLYGTTDSGGASGKGAVFELAPGAAGAPWTETVLYSFTGQNGDGSGSFAGVVIGAGGVLFGVTYGGGTTGKGGTVFKLTPPAGGGPWTETVLYSFTGPIGGGSGPFASLVLSPTGLLYGTTEYGGPNNTVSPGYGTVFQVVP